MGGLLREPTTIAPGSMTVWIERSRACARGSCLRVLCVRTRAGSGWPGLDRGPGWTKGDTHIGQAQRNKCYQTESREARARKRAEGPGVGEESRPQGQAAAGARHVPVPSIPTTACVPGCKCKRGCPWHRACTGDSLGKRFLSRLPLCLRSTVGMRTWVCVGLSLDDGIWP